MNDAVKIGDRVTAYDAVIDYYARGEPRVGSAARHGSIIETDETRIRVAWDGGRNRRWLRRNTEGISWHRGECSDINAEAIQALEERNRQRAPDEPIYRDRPRSGTDRARG